MRLQDRVANELLLPSGDTSIALIDTRDIAAVAAKLLLDGVEHGKAYTLTGGEVFLMARWPHGCLPSPTEQSSMLARRLKAKSSA